MQMRFLEFDVLDDRVSEFRDFYAERVAPALRETDGCLFASLLQHTVHPDECISLTFWRDRESVLAYEESPLYDRLLEESRRFLASTRDWRVRVSHRIDPDETLESRETPATKVYTVDDAEGETVELDPDVLPTDPHVRMVTVRVQPGRFDEFRDRYREHVVPVLRDTEGCRAVFLAEAEVHTDVAVSVTVWDSDEAARRYELAGTYGELTAQFRDLLDDMERWQFADAGGVLGGSSTAPPVRRYKLVAGSEL